MDTQIMLQLIIGAFNGNNIYKTLIVLSIYILF